MFRGFKIVYFEVNVWVFTAKHSFNVKHSEAAVIHSINMCSLWNIKLKATLRAVEHAIKLWPALSHLKVIIYGAILDFTK